MSRKKRKTTQAPEKAPTVLAHKDGFIWTQHYEARKFHVAGTILKGVAGDDVMATRQRLEAQLHAAFDPMLHTSTIDSVGVSPYKGSLCLWVRVQCGVTKQFFTEIVNKLKHALVAAGVMTNPIICPVPRRWAMT